MRFLVGVFLLHLAAIVWAGGYQGCLERVQLYQAYQIDEFNAPADRIFGFKCRRWRNNQCQNDDWLECRSRNGGGRCNFDELVFFLGGAPQRVGYTVLKPGTNRLDERASALACFTTFRAHNTRIRNFPAVNAMKTDVNEWNDFVKKLGNHMDQTYQRLRPNLTPEQIRLYSDIDYTTDRIIEARIGDHGYYLVQDARTRLAADGLTIRIQQLNNGVNPAQAIDPTQHAWETVDWGETIRQRPATMSLDRARQLVNDFNRDHFAGNSEKAHLAVIKSHKYVKARIVTCRRP